MNDRRNPTLARADGEELSTYIRRLDEHIARLEWQSEGHRMWYTHKNPYGCWICDAFFILGQLRSVAISEANDASSEDLNNTKSE